MAAAGRGCVSSAGWDAGGYGNLVVIEHRAGMTSWYAHLDTIAVRPGACVVAGTPVGTVGSTGHSTGPHLHFELRLRGAAVDPLSGPVSHAGCRRPERSTRPRWVSLNCSSPPASRRTVTVVMRRHDAGSSASV